MPKRVAAVVTEYRKNSHADVILQQALNGYPPDGKERPDFQIVSVYTDQVARADLSRDLAKKHGFRISPTIADALTHGGKGLAVDGVLSIGEHGDYKDNELGQKLYPRRRFFEEITKVFETAGMVVPVFSDKHLATNWDDAKWMYDRARKLMFPFLAGSSLPVTYRRPDLTLPKNCEIAAAVQLGYGGPESYGFHAVESLQCMVERRKGGETGVKAVTAFFGKGIWERIDRDPAAKAALDAAAGMVGDHAPGDIRTGSRAESWLMEIEYLDGLKGFVAMPSGWTRDGDGSGFTFAAQVKGEAKPSATSFYLQPRGDQFPHFAQLVRAFDAMLRTGHAPYPIERTLLTTGILAAAMQSRFKKGERIETPHLAIAYQPREWPHGGAIPEWAIEASKKK